MRRVAVIGNVAGGKTTLARALAGATGLPYHEYDALLWRGNARVPHEEVLALEKAWLDRPRWIIDGLGAWEALERRLDLADTIVYVDLPLWLHYAWAAQRQIRSAQQGPEPHSARPQLETEFLFRIMAITHRRTRPRLLAYLGEVQGKKIIHLRKRAELERLIQRRLQREAARRARLAARQAGPAEGGEAPLSRG
jgi:adenylate kinase family enzyme